MCNCIEEKEKGLVEKFGYKEVFQIEILSQEELPLDFWEQTKMESHLTARKCLRHIVHFVVSRTAKINRLDWEDLWD